MHRELPRNTRSNESWRFFPFQEESSPAGCIPAFDSVRHLSAGRRCPGNRTRTLFILQNFDRSPRNIIRHARYVSAPSLGLKQLSERADPFTVQVIPNGVDCEYFKPGPKSEHSSLTLLSVGRLHPQKNVQRMLETLLAIRNQSGIPATARVIGDGPERKNLEKFARQHDLDGAVSFEGWLPRSEVAAAYRSATVLVQLSSYEGMSNTILEALASGLPVVASRIPENRT